MLKRTLLVRPGRAYPRIAHARIAQQLRHGRLALERPVGRGRALLKHERDELLELVRPDVVREAVGREDEDVVLLERRFEEVGVLGVVAEGAVGAGARGELGELACGWRAWVGVIEGAGQLEGARGGWRRRGSVRGALKKWVWEGWAWMVLPSRTMKKVESPRLAARRRPVAASTVAMQAVLLPASGGLERQHRSGRDVGQ